MKKQDQINKAIEEDFNRFGHIAVDPGWSFKCHLVHRKPYKKHGKWFVTLNRTEREITGFEQIQSFRFFKTVTCGDGTTDPHSVRIYKNLKEFLFR